MLFANCCDLLITNTDIPEGADVYVISAAMIIGTVSKLNVHRNSFTYNSV
jgi:hypothetical protein